MSTVLQARSRLRFNVRDGNDTTTLTDEILDNALLEVGRRFCRQTRCLLTSSTVAITAASSSFPVTVPLAAGWTPERIIDVIIAGEDRTLRLVDYPTINSYIARDDSEGMPELLAFIDASTAGTLWPTPDIAYTAKMRWWLPFTSWTAGDSGANSTSINLPDELLDCVIRFGAPALLKYPSAEQAFASEMWKMYLDEETRHKHAGRLGAREQIRQPMDMNVPDPRADQINPG
jgi:hypothetical protein